MRRTRWATGVVAGLLALLAAPAAALADGSTLQDAVAGKLPADVAINSVWVLVAGILVMFMQAGFAFLEIGFSRGKNAGTVVAKILVNFAICGLLSMRSASPSRSARATRSSARTASSWPARTPPRTSRSPGRAPSRPGT